jgi:lipoate-protein ligase A
MTLPAAPPILRRRLGSARMRLLDLGTVPWIRSQSVHHAVAECFEDDSPDTVVLVRPDRPYVCVGHHGLGPRPSPAALRRLGLPVVRRRLGGGTVLITPDQTFYVLVVHRRRLPLPGAESLRWCLGPAVAAYARLGVAAEVGPGTDVTGSGRKLCGSGSASIGTASVFGGNVLGAFDAGLFVDALRLPSAAARRLMAEELRAQMGSVEQVTGAVPGPAEVVTALYEAVEEACDTRLEPGTLSPAEQAALPRVERWLRRSPAPPPPGSPGCWKVRAGCGLVRVVLSRPRRAALLITVRQGAVAAVTAERPEDRELATALDAGLRGRGLESAPEASARVAAEDRAGLAAALGAARRLLG